jgi:hypothetical protein
MPEDKHPAVRLHEWLMMHVGSREANELRSIVIDAVVAEREACAQIADRCRDCSEAAAMIRDRTQWNG